MGDPEAESPKATHRQHVHVEPYDDARTQHIQAQVIISASSASYQMTPKQHGTYMEHVTLKGREGGRVTIGPRAQSE